MSRTLALVAVSVAIGIGLSLLVTTAVKLAPRLRARADEIEEILKEAAS